MSASDALDIAFGLETPRGPVRVAHRVSAAVMTGLAVDPGIGSFEKYQSLYPTAESLARQAALPEADLCVALDADDRVVAYVVLRPPEPADRWAELNPPVMLEILAETSRGWRGQGLLRPMLAQVIEQPAHDDRILYMVGYSWTWDLMATGMDLMTYRGVLAGLLKPHGFREYRTNEPNVALRQENIFMARIGRNIDQQTKNRFMNLLFGILDDDY